MKQIRQLAAPTPGLDAYLRGGVVKNKDWKGFRKHAGGNSYLQLIEALANLQHGLCGYCEIDINERDRQVEHIIPQSAPKHGTTYALDHGNLIACCKGGTLETDDQRRRLDPVRRNLSCGQAKGNLIHTKFIDPRTLPSLPSVTRVTYNGRIEPDTAACTICNIAIDNVIKTIEILGLNNERLRRARENHWNALSDNWESEFDDPGIIEAAAREELQPDRNSRLPRFLTTSRSYFGDYGEKVLSKYPRDWI